MESSQSRKCNGCLQKGDGEFCVCCDYCYCKKCQPGASSGFMCSHCRAIMNLYLKRPQEFKDEIAPYLNRAKSTQFTENYFVFELEDQAKREELADTLDSIVFDLSQALARAKDMRRCFYLRGGRKVEEEAIQMKIMMSRAKSSYRLVVEPHVWRN